MADEQDFGDRGEHGLKFGPDSAHRRTFLEELRRTGHIYHACKVAGISYQTMKNYREGGKREDLDFESEYKQAMGDYVGMLKAEAQRRAVEGWEERPIVDKEGEVVGHVHKYSDRLLELLLKRSDPEYRERFQVEAETKHTHEHAHTHEIDFEKLYKELTPDEREAWKMVLRGLVRESATGEEAAPPKEQQH